jgi:hypothetical protein
MSVGSVGEGAVVLQGQNLSHVSITVQLDAVDDVAKAQSLVDQIRERVGGRPAFGTTLRRLEPAVLVNRRQDLLTLSESLNAPTSVIVVHGVAGVGKSSLARAALELRSPGIPVIWLPAESTSPATLVAALNDACELHLTAGTDVVGFAHAVLSGIDQPVVVVLDGAEVLLGADFRFAARDYTRLFELFTTAEHAIKMIMTTRVLPAESDGNSAVRIIGLAGIEPRYAEGLLRARSADSGGAAKFLELGLMNQLDGNPKLITLLAASLDMLPPSIIAASLREATDIGAFVAREVIANLTPAERELILTASVMPSTFSLDDLLALHKARLAADAGLTPVKSLLRRTLFERTDSGDYFMHALISENADPRSQEVALANTAAATWFEQKAAGIDIEAVAWAMGRLQAAADLDPGPEVSIRARDFLERNQRDLSFAGHSRGLIRLARTIMHGLDPGEQLVVRFRIATELGLINDPRSAATELEEVWAAVQQFDDDPSLNHMSCLIASKLGDVKLQMGDIAAAEELADHIEPKVLDDDVHTALRFHELRFQIARKKKDPADMLARARTCFELAYAWDDEEGATKQTRDAVAEAHFALAIAYINHPQPMVRHVIRNFVAQLRIKLDIGKLGGVASGLYNLGHLIGPIDADLGTLMAVTSVQMRAAIGQLPMSDEIDVDLPEFVRITDDPQRFEATLQKVARVDERLLPYARAAVQTFRAEPADRPSAEQ